MFLITCDKKLTISQFIIIIIKNEKIRVTLCENAAGALYIVNSPTHASTKRKITDELKHNAGWCEVREGSPVEVQWAVRQTIRTSLRAIRRAAK